MPKYITRNYRLFGLATVKIYSQAEMATALDLTPKGRYSGNRLQDSAPTLFWRQWASF